MGIGGSTMLGWLLPDASYQALIEGWDRQHYRPRHGRPPLVVRGASSAASVLGRARERYLGAAEEESLAGAPGRRPRSADLTGAGRAVPEITARPPRAHRAGFSHAAAAPRSRPARRSEPVPERPDDDVRVAEHYRVHLLVRRADRIMNELDSTTSSRVMARIARSLSLSAAERASSSQAKFRARRIMT